VNPAADTFVSASNPSGNYGGAGALEMSGAGTLKGEFQALMKFDLSGVKSGFDAALGGGQWQVQSATLQLTTANPTPQPTFNANAAGQFSVAWMQNDAWVEGTGSPGAPTTDGVSYATLPTFLGAADQGLGTFSFPGGVSGSNSYNLALPSAFVSDILAGDSASLRVFASDSAMSYLFNSRNNGTAGNRPLLTINAVAVPEPAGGVIWGSLWILGAITSRRRRSAT
jgi:hypothetical protein